MTGTPFIQTLQSDQIFAELTSVCQSQKVADFADLCWGEEFDIMTAVRDPGLLFSNQERLFVLMRINDEIRYYAGLTDPDPEVLQYEMGIFPTVKDALTYGHEYLLNNRDFAEIKIERLVIDSSRNH
jgi:hypothetical protein